MGTTMQEIADYYSYNLIDLKNLFWYADESEVYYDEIWADFTSVTDISSIEDLVSYYDADIYEIIDVFNYFYVSAEEVESFLTTIDVTVSEFIEAAYGEFTTEEYDYILSLFDYLTVTETQYDDMLDSLTAVTSLSDFTTWLSTYSFTTIEEFVDLLNYEAVSLEYVDGFLSSIGVSQDDYLSAFGLTTDDQDYYESLFWFLTEDDAAYGSYYEAIVDSETVDDIADVIYAYSLTVDDFIYALNLESVDF
jgi:hypothetical protein